MKVTPEIEITNEDCMNLLKRTPDNFFELGIVDVPYGIGEGSEKIKSRHHSQRKYKTSDWDDNAPDKQYFDQLIRVTKNQIVWGANTPHPKTRSPIRMVI